MPLMKSGSKAAFGKNVATEMRAGKPQKQALAIAFAQKRRADGGSRPGSSVPKGRNYKGNRFAHLMKAKSTKAKAKPLMKTKAAAAAKKAGVKPMGLPLAMAMRG